MFNSACIWDITKISAPNTGFSGRPICKRKCQWNTCYHGN